MASLLTDRQREDLHVSILEYLQSASFSSAAAAFQSEAEIPAASVASARGGLLAKKWTSVIRLQKKIMDLEAQVSRLNEDLKSGKGISRPGAGGSGSGASRAEAVPRAPAAHTLTGHRALITSVALHPVFTIVASASDDAQIKLWDTESGDFERTLKGHTNSVQCVAFDPTGQFLASASADLSAKLWDFSPSGDYRCLRTLNGHDHSVTGVTFVGGSSTLATASRDAVIKIWEVDTGYCIKTLSGHSDWVRKVVSNAGGDMLASCSSDQSVRVWAMPAGTPVATLRGHEHVVECVAFSSPEFDAAMTKHKRIKASTAALKDTVEGKSGDEPSAEVAEYEALDKADRGNGGEFILSGSRDKTIRFWNVAAEQLVMTMACHGNWVRGVAFHPFGLLAYSVAEDRTLRVTDLTTGRTLKTIDDAHEHFVTSIAVNSTHALLVTGGVDKTIRVWETR